MRRYTVREACGLFNGLGSCYNACGVSAELIIIQADLIALLERLRAGIDVTDDKLAFSSIAAVGPGDHFLDDAFTIKMLRSGEFYTQGSFDRLGERSPNRQEDSLLAHAHKRIEGLLQSHVPAVSDRTAEEVHRWAQKKIEQSSRS